MLRSVIERHICPGRASAQFNRLALSNRAMAEAEQWMNAQVNASSLSPDDKKTARRAVDELTRVKEDYPPRNAKPAFVPRDRRAGYQGTPETTDPTPNVEEKMVEAELGTAVRQALAAFSEEERKLLLESSNGEKTQKELAAELGVTQGRISQRLKQLHQRFAAAIGQQLSMDRILRMAPAGYGDLLQTLPGLALSDAVLSLVGQVSILAAWVLDGEARQGTGLPEERPVRRKHGGMIYWLGKHPLQLFRLMLIDGVRGQLRQRTRGDLPGLGL